MIPVNLVTGFLGVGKTTAIRHLLARHPAQQRWAVLVNEFGEVGVDGALLDDPEVAVQEVAGGCLCCVAAPAFTTGLNRLIRRYRPDRILVEPSGLGHPAQVLATLTGPLYSGVLDVRATVCLVDARHLGSPRHREHPNFVDQIHLADVLVANKVDLYGAAERAAFESFAVGQSPPKQVVGWVEHGRLDPAWLDSGRDTGRRAAFPEAHAFLVESGAAEPAPEVGDWLLIEGSADGYFRAGWLMRQQRAWPRNRIATLIGQIRAERSKAICLTESGWLAFNQDHTQTVTAPADGLARLELIDPAPLDSARIDALLRHLNSAADPTSD